MGFKGPDAVVATPALVASHVAPRLLTQADVDREVQRAIQRGKPADYDDVAAEAARSEELQRHVEALEADLTRIRWETRRNELAAAHRVPDDLRDELMTAAGDETLQLQAERLAVVAQRERAKGNVAPREGSLVASGDTEERDLRAFTNELFENNDW